MRYAEFTLASVGSLCMLGGDCGTMAVCESHDASLSPDADPAWARAVAAISIRWEGTLGYEQTYASQPPTGFHAALQWDGQPIAGRKTRCDDGTEPSSITAVPAELVLTTDDGWFNERIPTTVSLLSNDSFLLDARLAMSSFTGTLPLPWVHDPLYPVETGEPVLAFCTMRFEGGRALGCLLSGFTWIRMDIERDAGAPTSFFIGSPVTR
jgi:hypothetical protein